MTPAERASLRAHLLATGISGDTATPRSSAVENAEALAAGDPDKHLGYGARGRDAAAVMRAVAELCGCSPDLDDREGPGVIDAERTLEHLARVADALRDATARPGARMIVATGHPTGLLPMYQQIARALTDAGVTLETPIEDVVLRKHRGRKERVRYLDGVAVMSRWPHLAHSHDPGAMEAMLDALERPPDLILADHGFAGAAAARRLPTVCFTDVNDPALAVAAEEGDVIAAVPCDDNLAPRVYAPVAAFLCRAVTGG